MLPTFLTTPRKDARPRLAASTANPAPIEAAGVIDHPDPKQRADYEALHELENRLASHRLSWIRAGRALAEINERSLYRVRSASFEQYLQERWNMSRRHALDLITAAAVAENVKLVKHTLSVRAAVKLAKLAADQQPECLKEAIHGAGTLSPTADYLAAAVAARLGKNPKRKRTSKKPKPVRMCLAGGTLTLLAKRASVDMCALLDEAIAEIQNLKLKIQNPHPSPAATSRP